MSSCIFEIADPKSDFQRRFYATKPMQVYGVSISFRTYLVSLNMVALVIIPVETNLREVIYQLE